jgi:hypothetical protein
MLPKVLFYTQLEALPDWMGEFSQLEYLYVQSSTVDTVTF